MLRAARQSPFNKRDEEEADVVWRHVLNIVEALVMISAKNETQLTRTETASRGRKAARFAVQQKHIARDQKWMSP